MSNNTLTESLSTRLPLKYVFLCLHVGVQEEKNKDYRLSTKDVSGILSAVVDMQYTSTQNTITYPRVK
jgi:hypothetical protein